VRANQFQLGDADYLRFQKFVSKHSGLHFPENRRGELEKGLTEALENAPADVTSLESYYNFLTQSGDKRAERELARLINILTIGETHFFRNTAQFEALANFVLPGLIAKKREAASLLTPNGPGVPQLRIWSAGCSTGEEPYSIAILLRELIPDIDKWRIFILGTDINTDSLARARQAVYREWSFREEKARERRSIYFEKRGLSFYLNDDIRRQVTFAQQNLIEDDFPSTKNGIMAMDLILCRNVTIYFSQEITEQLTNKFYATLVDDGWLVVGHAEPSLTAYRNFQTRSYPKTIFYQKSNPPVPTLPKAANGVMAKNGDGRISSPVTARLNDPNTVRKTKYTTTRLSTPGTAVLNQSISTPEKLKNNTAVSRESLVEKEKVAAKRYEEAQLLLVQGRTDKAIHLLEALVAEHDRYTAAYCLLARTHADQGQCLQARSWSMRAIKTDSLNPKPYYILALLDENEGLLNQAIENYKKMLYIETNNPLPHFHLGVLYQKVGQIDLAQRALGNAVKILESMPSDQFLPENGENVGWLLHQAKELLREKE